MDDKTRALLGDHEAAKRLTDAGVLLPCMCGGKAGMVCCDMLPPPIEAGASCSTVAPTEYQQAIPVCPTVLPGATLSAQALYL